MVMLTITDFGICRRPGFLIRGKADYHMTNGIKECTCSECPSARCSTGQKVVNLGRSGYVIHLCEVEFRLMLKPIQAT